MKTENTYPGTFPQALPSGLVGIEEQRWQRVEHWLLEHLADVQDRAFILMPMDLAAYEEMMRRCASGFLGSSSEVIGSSNEVIGSSSEVIGSSKEVIVSSSEVFGSSKEVIGSSSEVIGSSSEVIGSSNEVIGSSSEVFGSSKEVIGSSKEVSGSSKERVNRGLEPKHRADHGMSCSSPDGCRYPKSARAGRRVVATPRRIHPSANLARVTYHPSLLSAFQLSAFQLFRSPLRVRRLSAFRLLIRSRPTRVSPCGLRCAPSVCDTWCPLRAAFSRLSSLRFGSPSTTGLGSAFQLFRRPLRVRPVSAFQFSAFQLFRRSSR